MDLRAKVLRAYDRGEGSQRALAARFDLALSTVQSWLKRRRETGSAAPLPAPGAAPKLGAEGRDALRDIVGAAPDGTLGEWADALAERTGLRLHPSTVWRYARRSAEAGGLGKTRKKRPPARLSSAATT